MSSDIEHKIRTAVKLVFGEEIGTKGGDILVSALRLRNEPFAKFDSAFEAKGFIKLMLKGHNLEELEKLSTILYTLLN